MKRAITMAVLVGLLVLIIPSAVLAKNHKPGRPPQEPVGGTTCLAAGAWSGPPIEVQVFEITLTADDDYACVDVKWSTPGAWYILVTGSGARSLTLVPRDSISPGDSCGGIILRGNAVYGPLTLPPDGGEIPAGFVNACGTEFAEWVDDPGICGAVLEDTTIPCLITTAEPEHEHPLAFQASLAGSKKATATIHVTLPPP